MTRVFGLVFVVVSVAWLGMYVWLRFATERTLRELREGMQRRRPTLEPWERPTVIVPRDRRVPYDWQRAGDL